jgi:hypothetical protein
VSDSSGHFLHRPKAPLPDAADFDPWAGDLDARHAWRNFGELSLAQAHKLFLENPCAHQEDFMFMGPKAFAYYFPVIDRYLREVHGEDPDDDCSVGILGRAIAMQLAEATSPALRSVAVEAAALASHVMGDPARYTPDERMQERLVREWRRVAGVAAKRSGP